MTAPGARGPTRLLLVRHGQAQVNVDARLSSQAPGSPLTEHGRRQAAEVAVRIGAGVDHVYASPLQRARETGEIIAAEVGSGLTVLDALAEVGIGDLEGQPGSDDTVLRHPVFRRWQTGDGLAEPLAGGETGEALLRRAGELLDLVREHHLGATVVAVTHGGFLSAVVPNVARDVPMDRAHAQIPLNTAVVELLFETATQEWVCISWPTVSPGRNAQTPVPVGE